MLALIQKHNVKIIAIGNGTASRESELFVVNLIKNIIWMLNMLLLAKLVLVFILQVLLQKRIS